MLINCPGCDTSLELPEDAGGAETDCPVCGVEFEVESPSSYPEFESAAGPPVRRSVFDGADAEPAEIPSATVHCPICEAANDVSAGDCRACGTNFRRTTRQNRHRAPRGIFVGDILWTTATIFGRAFRVLVPAVILEATALAIAASVILFPVLVVVGAVLAGANPNRNPVLAAFLLTSVLVPMFLIWQAVHVGHYRTMLKLARGEPVSFGDLFSVRGLFGGEANREVSRGSLTLKMVSLGCLFWLLCLLGGMFLIVPGLVFALVAWPFGRIVVDRNPPGTAAITESIELVTPHWPGVLSVVSLLWATQIGVTVVPFLAGSVFATLLLFLVLQPFASLALTVTYLRLRDEPTAIENAAAEAEWV